MKTSRGIASFWCLISMLLHSLMLFAAGIKLLEHANWPLSGWLAHRALLDVVGLAEAFGGGLIWSPPAGTVHLLLGLLVAVLGLWTAWNNRRWLRKEQTEVQVELSFYVTNGLAAIFPLCLLCAGLGHIFSMMGQPFAGIFAPFFLATLALVLAGYSAGNVMSLRLALGR